jgi:hypothetical protein
MTQAARTRSFGKASLGLAGSGTKLQGSYIGVKADGATAGVYDKNCTGVVAYGTNVEIGSGSPEDRNIFFSKCSVAQSAGIAVVNGSTTIFGNYIGMAKDGVTDLTPEAADANGPHCTFLARAKFTQHFRNE